MLRAIRARECDGARRLLGVALSLVLVFRLLLGPALLPPPAPGMIAICGGTTIVYVDLSAGKGAPGKPQTDPCPFYGFAAAPPEPGVPVLTPRRTVFAGHPAPAAPMRMAQAGRAGYAPRGPPPLA